MIFYSPPKETLDCFPCGDFSVVCGRLDGLKIAKSFDEEDSPIGQSAVVGELNVYGVISAPMVVCRFIFGLLVFLC